MKPSWSVILTVKSTPDSINYFIQYYLNIGVSEIFLFLDSPNDFEKNIIVAIKDVVLEQYGDRYSKLECRLSRNGDGINQVIYFWVRHKQALFYFYIDKYNFVRGFSSNNAQLFTLNRLENNKFAVGYNGKYLSVTPQGKVSFSATEIKAWELLELI
ncbi:hypothetical protein DDU33_02490 [Actinobacillus porcitonsillarum]|uniref:Uncharacterized protein n=1 Tax=Actinobacillus porcitonsillarum TaxID=189834 RepID=A0A2U8FHJ9_9PAST|nr:hypothetical protein [Actinobacillus porcitonsillarum]AWI50433.1 hypothetical protein DDU33_02490 [Actinobacillus porcitonsillarum]